MTNDFKHLGELMDGAREAVSQTTWSQAGNESKPAKISGVPLRRADDTFESFDLTRNPGMEEALNQCRAVAEGRAWCAMLAGRPGNGKTHLAVAAMNAYGMLSSYFWKVPDYLDWLRRMAFDENWSIDQLTLNYRTSAFLLVLDDLGTENQTDWAHEQLYRVLDSRYDNELPTIITTNQDAKRIDGRIYSRYAEGLVVCKGDDLRRKGAR